MPLLKIEALADDVQLALWRMTEEVGELPCPQSLDLSAIQSVRRQKEMLTTYALLSALAGRNDLVIKHNESGRPYVNGMEISISHTRGWAVMLMSRKYKLGVDIEYMSDRVSRIVDKFMREDEDRHDVHRQLVNWCAKEAVYKLRSEEDLQYFEMRLHDFTLLDEGKVRVDDLKRQDAVEVNYRINTDYVWTWTCE